MPFKYDRGAVVVGQSVAYMVSDLNYIVLVLLPPPTPVLVCLVLSAVATFCILNALGWIYAPYNRASVAADEEKHVSMKC